MSDKKALDELTEADLLAILQDVSEKKQGDDGPVDPGAFTFKQAIEVTGKGHVTTQRTLDMLVDEGKIIRDRMKKRNAWGIVTTTIGYRIVKQGLTDGVDFSKLV